ncbi:unnamed protein product [Linum trigynum]|uniref:Uncharacterized protein n=1 Tax=Linum trigynum TaxID=586398 RepID=A0AAV2D751_9ROSI
MALALQSRVSDFFAVDIHPAARIGKEVLFDHATGVVVGETTVIGNNVSILHHVTLSTAGIEERIWIRFATRQGDLVSPLEVLKPKASSKPEPVVRTRKMRAERARMRPRPSQDLAVVVLEARKS